MFRLLHAQHWMLPLIAVFVWWGMLIAFLAGWAIQGHPVYPFISSGQTIVYASDIGALPHYQTLFIVCASVQAVFYWLTLCSERYLRHSGRLLPNWRRMERIMVGLSILSGVVGQIGLILVACYNTVDHHRVHDSMLIMFLVGMALSALFMSAEIIMLDRSYYRDRAPAQREKYRQFKWRFIVSYTIKLTWVVVAIALAIGFGVLNITGNKNASAILEWTLAFFYGIYLISLCFDLLPATHIKKGHHLETKITVQLQQMTDYIEDDLTEIKLTQSTETIHGQIGDRVYGTRMYGSSRPNMTSLTTYPTWSPNLTAQTSKATT